MVVFYRFIVLAIIFNQSLLPGISFIPDWPHVADGISQAVYVVDFNSASVKKPN